MRVILLIMAIWMGSFDVYARLEDLFQNQTSIEKPFELRDPFQPPRFKSDRAKKRKKEFSGKFERNVLRLDQEINLAEIQIVGVLIGKKRRVMIRFNKEVYTFSEGANLGSNGPEIKAILAGGIILVEQITNVYGEPEYIETVIPISR